VNGVVLIESAAFHSYTVGKKGDELMTTPTSICASINLLILLKRALAQHKSRVLLGEYVFGAKPWMGC